MKKTISTDIDGVLNYYPGCWLEYIFIKTGKKFENKIKAKEKLGKDKYSEIKDQYRKSEYKANLEPNKKMIKALKKIKEKGHKIIIATSRPINSEKYPALYALTENWLKKNKIPFDVITYKDENCSFLDIYKPELHIDDEEIYLNSVKDKNVLAIYFNKNLKETLKNKEKIVVLENENLLEELI